MAKKMCLFPGIIHAGCRNFPSQHLTACNVNEKYYILNLFEFFNLFYFVTTEHICAAFWHEKFAYEKLGNYGKLYVLKMKNQMNYLAIAGKWMKIVYFYWKLFYHLIDKICIDSFLFLQVDIFSCWKLWKNKKVWKRQMNVNSWTRLKNNVGQ